MRRLRKFCCLSLVCLLISGSLACGQKKEPAFVGQDENLQHTIYVCSDTHLLSVNVLEDAALKERYTSDGRVQTYDYEIVEALVNKVNRDKPEALIITGDLSYNGELDSHKELVKLLDKVDKDIKVLVIPGNHDTYILNGLVADCSTTDESFRKLYENYGYSGAVSYDPETLSYAYQLADDLVALMLDTPLCRYNEEENRNTIGGFVSYDTREWIEGILQEAEKKGQRVICFTHHNVLDHDTGFTSGYTIIDNELLVELLMKYNVMLNFSGHLHIQNIAKETQDGKTLYDIASSSLLTYSNTVGRLDIYSDGFMYKKESLVPFEGFTELSKKHFMDVYYDKNLAKFEEIYGDDGDAVLKFTCLCNVLYFDGDYPAVMAERNANKRLLNLIKKNNTKLSHYFRIDDTDQKTLSGFWK